MKWSTACTDWEKRIVKKQTLIPCGALFPEQAEQALAVFKALHIVDLPGSPMAGEVTEQWMLDFAGAIFGAYNAENGRRLIREFFLLISKKNTKSTSAALIMLTALILNWRNSAEYLILAPTKEVANNCFDPARDAIKADPELSSLFQVQDHLRTFTHRQTGSTLKVVAADKDTVSGKKATGILIDELWLFGKKNNADSMLKEATGGLASRIEGFVVYLSTQSDEPPAGVFKAKLDYARKVRDGEIVDNQFLPVIYEFPANMIKNKSYLKPENFYITNPNLGASVDEEFLQREIRVSQEEGEQSFNTTLAKHLNIEIGMNLRNDRWPGADFWLGCADKTLTYEEIIRRSEVICIGIDGGGLDDLLGLTVLGRDEETQNWLHWSYAWAHESVLERRKSEAPLLRDLEEAGELTICKKMGDDVDQVVDIIEEIYTAELLYKIGVDPIGIGSILDEIEEREIPQDKVTGISQGWKLGGAIKTTERKLAARDLRHCNQQLMTWSVGNARVEKRANSILITKQASGTAKIDPLISTFNAVALMETNPRSMKAGYQILIV